VRKSNP
jgi:RNA-binding protein 23/39